MQSARLDASQDGVKIAQRNINNLRYADDTTLMAESKEELKSLLMRMKEKSEKAGLKLNIHKMKIMASSPAILMKCCSAYRLNKQGNQNPLQASRSVEYMMAHSSL